MKFKTRVFKRKRIMDNNEKAYLLGWIASNGIISKESSTISITTSESDSMCLKLLQEIMCDKTFIEENNGLLTWTFYSPEVVKDICARLGLDDGTPCIPKLSNKNTWSFIRGYFDGNGNINNITHYTEPVCYIVSGSCNVLKGISDFCKIPCELTDNELRFTGTNAIDFLGGIYKDHNRFLLDRKFKTYLEWTTWHVKQHPVCKVFKTDTSAVLPRKEKASDVGYDLTIIKEAKKLGKRTTLYDTGIKIDVQHGYYAEVYPRSSLSKSGYMLANSIGVIDPSYRNNIFVALIKVDDDAPDLVLPFRCCQLIFKKQTHCDIVEVEKDFNETLRGQGGFGSTGV